jgi:hypothetical protein
VKHLLAFWRSGNPLALVGLYAVGVAVSIAWVGVLPGEPTYEGPGRSVEVAVALSALVVFYLARGAYTALGLARFGHLLGGLYALVGGAAMRNPKLLGLAVLQALLVALLFSPALDRHAPRRLRRRGR